MKFNEIFIKHKNGTATPEEIEFIEAEIEKNELINDYLAEKIDLEMNTVFFEGLNKQVNVEKKIIKKSVNRKLAKVIGFTVSIMVTLVLLFQFVVVPAIDSYYYDPNKGYEEKYSGNGQFFLDIATLTNLHFPGINTSQAMAEPLGYGKYNIEIYQWDTFRNQTKVDRGKITRSETTIPFEFYKIMPFNSFSDAVSPQYKQDKEELQGYVDELEKLPETAFVSAYISFEKDLDMKEYMNLQDRMTSLRFSWIAIRHEDKYEHINTHIGFDPTGNGTVIEPDAVDEKKYPYFELANVYMEKKEVTPEILETHFTSQVKYMSARSSFITSLSAGAFSTELYHEALSYIEKNGVRTYGALVQGNAKDMLQFAKDDVVSSFVVNDVKVSMYEK